MIIDIMKAKEEFIKYTQNYNLKDLHINGKQNYSIRVMEISKQIAEGLKLKEEEIELAKLIGLLHDIARFEQYTRYGTFKDALSIDHGDLGVEILNKDIRKYINTNKYDEIIKIVIKNHNKYKIQEGLTKEQELFAKIVRDADKIDIIYESIDIFWKGKEDEIEKSEISKDVFLQFKNKKQIQRKNKQTEIDNVVSVIAFIFDINFKTSFEIIKNNDYINKVIDRYNIKNQKTKEELEEIRKIANEYIEKGKK